MDRVTEFYMAHRGVIAPLILSIVAFICGWCCCQTFGANIVKQEIPVEVPIEVPIKIPVEVAGETQIVYVEKETPNDADVEIHTEKPVIKMNYNDKSYEFETLENETQKFENGKLTVDTSSTTTLDVTPIVEKAVADNNKLKDAEFELEKKNLVDDFNKEKGKSKKHGFWTGVGSALGAGLLILAL